jgi:hypothetical protein
MSGGWVRGPKLPHECEKPAEAKYGDRSYIGAVWRCYCRKIWVFREGWYFGESPAWWHRTQPEWHKARWWEWIRWAGQPTF